MAGKKDFAGLNTGRVYAALETATTKKGQQGEASPQEKKERADELRTQGRKGCRAVRINMAFTPDNHRFVKTMSRISGVTMTEFTNRVIEKYREEHPEIYEKAQALIDEI